MGVGQEEKNMEKINTVTVETQKQKENKVVLSPAETNAPVTEAEACEFLKFIKHSKYNMVEQLNKTLEWISLLSLVTSFEPHRDALMKVLNQAYMAHNISVDKLDHLVGNIVMDNFISFSDDEIPSNGRGSTKALHITTKIKDCILSKVLIDTCL